MHLGEFGAVAREVKAADSGRKPPEFDTFTFCGEQIRLRPWIGGFPMMQFAATITNGGLLTHPDVLHAFYEVLEGTIHKGDWVQFKNLAREHGTDMKELEELLVALYNAWCSRPIQRPAGSSDGESGTGAGSPEPSPPSSPVSSPAASFVETKPPRKAAKNGRAKVATG